MTVNPAQMASQSPVPGRHRYDNVFLKALPLSRAERAHRR
jgi:hypothetical protein